MLLLAILFSPVLMLLVATLFATYARFSALHKASITYLASRSFLYAVIGVIVSFAFTVAWMNWYEKSSGYSAGNGPLGWMFFYGPLSAAIGQLIALTQWWFKKEK